MSMLDGWGGYAHNNANSVIVGYERGSYQGGDGSSLVPGGMFQPRRSSMIKPLLHITLPDDDGEDRHFAPIILALEAMISVNLWHIRRSLRRAQQGLGNPISPLYMSGVRYKEDDPGREDWRDCLEIIKRGAGDCLPLSTLVLRDDYELVPLGALRNGDRIFGDAGWTQVMESVVTGEKPILEFQLSNSCILRCSPEHRLFRDVDGRIEEIRAKEARVGDDLIQASTIPVPQVESEWPSEIRSLSAEDRAWLLGTYVADGWAEQSRFAISGLDGHPKEEQKRRVQALMNAATIDTRWHEKYIAVNDRDLASFFAQQGDRARFKHVSSLGLAASQPAIQALLDGLAADAGRAKTGDPESSLVYTTTSPTLAIQMRVLYRMLGISVSIKRTDEHGGLGKHPIYRVVPRLKPMTKGSIRRDKQFARVRSISEGQPEICGDITTDAGKFWLPESDVVVHNCDNLCAWRAAELRAAGIQAEPVIKWQHIPRELALQLGYPSNIIPAGGLSMVHVLVRWPNGTIEDPSKLLGMGGSHSNRM